MFINNSVELLCEVMISMMFAVKRGITQDGECFIEKSKKAINTLIFCSSKR